MWFCLSKKNWNSYVDIPIQQCDLIWKVMSMLRNNTKIINIVYSQNTVCHLKSNNISY